MNIIYVFLIFLPIINCFTCETENVYLYCDTYLTLTTTPSNDKNVSNIWKTTANKSICNEVNKCDNFIRVRTNSRRGSILYVTTRLTLFNVTEQNNGKYTCYGMNSIKIREVEILVTKCNKIVRYVFIFLIIVVCVLFIGCCGILCC
jgi:hypothetical protein